MKKTVAIVCLLLVFLCASFAAADSVEYTCGDYDYIILEDGTAEIVDAPRSIKTADIPEQLDGHTVTSIGESAFIYCKKLESLTIPETVTHIGVSAFENCYSLTSVTIPNSVVRIDANPFQGCDEITEVIVAPDHPALAVVDGVLFDKLENRLLYYPASSPATSYAIPEGTEVIAEGAFDFCQNLTQITIPDSVHTIGDMAFYRCFSLQSIVIPEGVTVIGRLTFHQCGELVSVTLPSTLKEIRKDAFGYCVSLTEFTVPDGVTFLGNEAFYKCALLTSVTLPDSLLVLEHNPFTECEALVEINVSPDHPTIEIVDGVVFDKSEHRLVHYPSTLDAQQYTVPEGTLVIGEQAFEGHNPLVSITLPEGVTKIGARAFRNCHELRQLNIPGSVTEIGDHAFADCTIDMLYIPAGVTTFGPYALNDCDGVEFVVEQGSPAEELLISLERSYTYAK